MICHIERAISLGAVYLLLPYRWAVVVIRTNPTGGEAKPLVYAGLLHFQRVVTTDVTQMTTQPSAYKGLSSYAIAPFTKPWANAEIFPKTLFLGLFIFYSANCSITLKEILFAIGEVRRRKNFTNSTEL